MNTTTLTISIDSQVQTEMNKIAPSDRPISGNIKDNLYYVNGLFKGKKKAKKVLKLVNDYFVGYKFKLIYNRNDSLAIRLKSLNRLFYSDTREIFKDYDWLIDTAEAMRVVSDVENEATFKTMAYLEVGRSNDAPLGLLASSQGALVLFNAIMAFAFKGQAHKDYLKQHVRVALVGSLVPDRFYDIGEDLLEKFEAHVYEKDFLGSAFTQEDRTPELEGVGKHSIKWYLPTTKKARKHHHKKSGLNPVEPFVKKDFFIEA